MGPSLEEKIAEHDSRRRRQQNDQKQHVLDLSGAGWTDGPPSEAMCMELDSKLSKASSSSSVGHQPGVFLQLVCQTVVPRSHRRKYNAMFLGRMSLGWKRQKQYWAELKPRQHGDRTSSPKNINERPVLRAPSVLQLHPTQSVPSIAVEKDVSVRNPYTSRRCSSDPSDGTPLTHHFQLPEIRRISELMDGSQSQDSSIADSVRACEHGDLIVTHDHFDDTPDGPYTARQQQNQWKNQHWRHKDTSFLSPPATFLPMKSTPSSQIVPESDYFGKVHIGGRTTDGKEDHRTTATEDGGTRSTMNDSINAQPSIKESGDSDGLNQKKPRGVNESSMRGCEFGRPSRGRTREELDHYSAKIGW